LALGLAAFPLVGSSSHWRPSPHTNPNSAINALAGFFVFAAGIGMFVFVYRARPWPALACLATAVLTGTFACGVLIGALAAFLSAPETRTS
jgi:hypothetical protein